MCGLFGVYDAKEAKLSYKESAMIKHMIMAGMVRGTDSLGLFLPNRVYVSGPKDNKVTTPIIKRTINMDINNMLDMYKDVQTKTGTYSIIGHHRAATLGAVTEDNAHPFHHNGTTLVHNGTLQSYELSKISEGASQKFDVDSEQLCYALSVAEDPLDVLTKITSGAYAIIYSHLGRNDRSIYMARNDQRPLHIAESKAGKRYYIASEKGMLEWLLNKNSIEYKNLRPLETNTLYRVSRDGIEETRYYPKHSVVGNGYVNSKSYSDYEGWWSRGKSKNHSTPTTYDHTSPVGLKYTLKRYPCVHLAGYVVKEHTDTTEVPKKRLVANTRTHYAEVFYPTSFFSSTNLQITDAIHKPCFVCRRPPKTATTLYNNYLTVAWRGLSGKGNNSYDVVCDGPCCEDKDLLDVVHNG